jgi:peptide deformylase
MGLLKIARIGHPVLFQRAKPVDDPGAPEIRRLAADMIETMEDAPGVGLAAPQVHVSLRLFVFRVPESRAGGGDVIAPAVLINPEIEQIGDEILLCTEGCLSIPGMRGIVPAGRTNPLSRGGFGGAGDRRRGQRLSCQRDPARI